MKFFHSFLLFIIFIFIYIHITAQYKKSQDLEIYELDYKDNSNLQEICDVRQPVVFRYPENVLPNQSSINLSAISSMEKEDGNTLNVFDIYEFFTLSSTPAPTILPFHSAIRLIKTDTNSRFFTENNGAFIEDAGLDEWMNRRGTALFKPSYNMIQQFDIMTGTKNLGLPMRYHTNTRKFIHVSEGRIMVKMAPFKNAKKLGFESNDLKEQYVSHMNCWNPSKTDLPIINKIRFLEFQVLENNVLYVPPYWIYSVQYLEDDVCLLEYNYKTMMNIVAHPGKYTRIFTNELKNVIQISKKYFLEKKDVEDGDGNGNGNGDRDRNRDRESGLVSTTTIEDKKVVESAEAATAATADICDMNVISKKISLDVPTA